MLGEQFQQKNILYETLHCQDLVDECKAVCMSEDLYDLLLLLSFPTRAQC